MDLSFYMYIFGSLALILGGTYTFFSRQSSIAGAIFLVGSIALTIFFGVRWFLPSGVRTTKGAWPPVINVCPDFLSLHTIVSGTTTEKVCIDTVGVASGAGGIERWPGTDTNEEKYLFHLFAADPTRQAKLCQQCKDKKVTWEGVYDPSGSCSSNTPPLPPASS